MENINKELKVLALKYRPKIFKELIGQEIIAETIANAIKIGKTPNAYLLTGIRGVGKTTTARLIAKALNCTNDNDQGKKYNKKDLCDHCRQIENSNHIDVLEMDAASKTGVDDVRDLIEFSRYGPTSAKYKIFIIDEVHMLSKQAFNALLKTLEEPPDYLKFIFATTEIKKIPVTVVSRCQRFDLSRIKTEELFQYVKKIVEKEKGNVTDDAIKLIVKISEGSVRDALSLLDRGLVSNLNNEQLNLEKAQKIYGYFDKSSLIELFYNLFKGDENKVVSLYREIYQTGVEPKVFLNDFLEILYFIKNISSISLDGSNFSLNDKEFNDINNISKLIDEKDVILFWQFTIKAMEELDIVTNPSLSVEMLLIRLMYLKDFNKQDFEETIITKNKLDSTINNNEISINRKTIDQMKSTSQQDEIKPKLKSNEINNKLLINNFEELIDLCTKKKEIKLKYELETNINLVAFDQGRIEIAFNEDLDKDFIKELSTKLYEWTNQRWIISLSKKEGLKTIKQEERINKEKMFEDVKKSKIYNEIVKILPDAELLEIKKNKKEND